MRCRLDINKGYLHTEIIVQTPQMTNEIKQLIAFIEQFSNSIRVKKDNEQLEISVSDVVYIENIERTTFLYTMEEMYELHNPLYELEREFDFYGFIRINKQTIINPRSIVSVKPLLHSRYELKIVSGEKLIVSRHYRKKFKAMFAKGGFYDA